PGSLVEGIDGMLYGSTSLGGVTPSGGTVFRVHKDGTGYAVIRSFPGFVGDGLQVNGLRRGNDGTLYGTTLTGGKTGISGTVFAMRPQPVLMSPVLSNGHIAVGFTSLPGSTNQIQRATSPNATWVTITNVIASTNGFGEAIDVFSPKSATFYRIARSKP